MRFRIAISSAVSLVALWSLSCGEPATTREDVPAVETKTDGEVAPAKTPVKAPLWETVAWQRCPVGQVETNGACEGEATKFDDWAAAGRSCAPGFRLPTVQEMTSLLGGCEVIIDAGQPGSCMACRNRDRCKEALGDDGESYWLFTTYTGRENFAWVAHLGNGFIAHAVKKGELGFAARCVKGPDPDQLGTAFPDEKTLTQEKKTGGTGREQPSVEDTQAALKEAIKNLPSCSKHGKGTVQVKVLVQSNGEPSDVTVMNEFAGTPLGECVASVYKKIRFEPFMAQSYSFVAMGKVE